MQLKAKKTRKLCNAEKKMKSDVVNNLNAGQDAQNDGDVIHL